MTVENVSQAKKSEKTILIINQIIPRLFKADRHKTAVDFQNEIGLHLEISTRTIPRRLNK